MTVAYTDSLDGVAAAELRGFFEGWPNPPSPETHLRTLRGSTHVWLARDGSDGPVIGFVTALSDGVLASFLPLLEVLPGHRGHGVGAELVRRMLVTLKGGLPQGAPTSPRLSNLVNFGLDVRLERMAEYRDACYTRYADDITFSHERDGSVCPRGTIDLARQILRVHGYTAHGRAKTSIRRRHQRQDVTGLVVNDGVRLPRKLRRRLRAIRHHIATGRPATLTEEQLRGWDAFESMVERASACSTVSAD